jgi:hypothetical protein
MIRAGLFAVVAAAALAGCAEAPMTTASGRADGAETGAAAPETLQCYGERICEAGGRRFCADTQKCSRSGGRTVLR